MPLCTTIFPFDQSYVGYQTPIPKTSKMKKLTIKNIVEFKGKSDRSKKNFVNDLKIDKPKTLDDGGGDYWVSCLSAIGSSYKANDVEAISDRQDDLKERYAETEYDRTKTMYKRNIAILDNYRDYDFKKIRPTKKIQFLKKHKDHSILTIKGLQIQATPTHVFSYESNDTAQVGAIWFIAKLDGFKKAELGMFSDILYRYLKVHYSKEYELNPKYCIAVDVYKNHEVSYQQLEKGEVPVILSSTLDEMKGLM
jgi:hypothetical protein